MTTSNIRVGQDLRLTVRFADFDISAGTDELFDPDDVTLNLLQFMGTSTTATLITELTPVVKDAAGIYHYDWTTPSDGKFQLDFIGETSGATPSFITDTRIFYVGTSSPTQILTSSQEFLFLGELSPLYLDPEVILSYIPDVDVIQITESIYRISLLLDEWLGPNLVVTDLMQDYIFAAVLCDLSKSYLLDNGLGGIGTSDKFTLGDLTVEKSRTGVNRFNGIYKGNISSWCELAYQLKNELLSHKVTYLAVVKGTNFINPIPMRQLRRHD